MDNLNFPYKKNLDLNNPARSLSDASQVLLPDSDVEWRDEPLFSGEWRTRTRSLQQAPEGSAALTLMAAMSGPLMSETPTQNARANDADLPIRAHSEQEAMRAALVYDWADLYRLPLNTLVENTPLTDAFSSPGLADDNQKMLDLLTAELRTLNDLEWLADHSGGSSLMHTRNQAPLTPDMTPAVAVTQEEPAPQLEGNDLLFPAAELPGEAAREEELMARAVASHNGEKVCLSLEDILGMQDELIAWSAAYGDELSGGTVVEHYPFYIENNESWQMAGTREHLT